MLKTLFSIKKQLFILLAISFCPVRGQQVFNIETGEIMLDAHVSFPERNIEVLDDGYIVTYNFKEALITESDLFPNCKEWNTLGFLQLDELGMPSIPYKTNWYEVGGSEPIIEIIDRKYVELPLQLAPARRPLVDGDSIVSESIIEAIPMIPFDGFFPSAVVEEIGFLNFKDNVKFGCKVYPIQYNYYKKVVRAYSSITYRVKFNENTSNKIFQRTNSAINIPQDNQTKYYLIVTSNKYLPAVDNLIALEKMMGFNVIVTSKDCWNSSEEVLDSVQTIYERTSKRLYALLIVGDHQDVPAKVIPKVLDRPQHVTDLYYACLDSARPTTPNLVYGRISVKSNAGAQEVVDKLCEYMLNPTADVNFYNNGLHCTTFDGDYMSHNNQQVPRFAWTSETIRSIMQEKINKDIIRVYHSDMGENTLQNSFEDEDLQDPSSWQGNADDIIQAINNGVFYVNYRGHGQFDSWASPAFSSASINKLNNTNKLPFIFSVTCLTGKFDGDSFCESALQLKEGGAIGIIGASEISFTGYNDCFAFGMFDAIWPNSGFRACFGDEEDGTSFHHCEIGQIKQQGYLYLDETYSDGSFLLYTKEVYHLFGDPCMRIYTEVPTEFEQAKIQRDSSSVRVNLGNETGRISFYNPKTGDVFCRECDNAVYETSDPDAIVVCISGHNKRALVDRVERIDTVKVDDIYYQIANNEAMVIASPDAEYSYNGNITIRESVWYRGKKYAVTKVHSDAFKGSPITSISLPNTIKSLPDEVFDGCANLVSVNLPSVDTISDFAFRGCASLKSIQLPDSLKMIGEGSFAHSGLVEIELPDSVISIGNESFRNCKKLKNVILGKKLQSIGARAFSDCDSILRIECLSILPPSCSDNLFPQKCCSETVLLVPDSSYNQYCRTNIWRDFEKLDIKNYDFCFNGGFYKIIQGTDVKLVSAGKIKENLYFGSFNVPYEVGNKGMSYWVVGVDDNAFHDCQLLKSVSFESLMNLGEGIFVNCINLEKVEIPQSIINIPKRTFQGCSALAFVNLPETVARIDDEAFSGCGIEYISIPDSLLYLGNSAFKGCSNLRKVSFPEKSLCDRIEPSTFEDCNNLIDVLLPSNVNTICEKAFKNCCNLTNFVMPTQTKAIGNEAFAFCHSLKEILSCAITPYAETDSVFWEVDKNNCIVRRPPALSYYDQLKGWRILSILSICRSIFEKMAFAISSQVWGIL